MSFGYVPDNYDVWEAHEREQERRQAEYIDDHSIGYCAHCDEPVFDDSIYYEIDGKLIHDECAMEWLEQFKIGGRRRCSAKVSKI